MAGDVRPIMLPDEEKIFKSLKDKGDRLEFQKIFWARRDPDLATRRRTSTRPSTRSRARPRPTASTRSPAAGLATDCGRVYILLGKPDEVQRDPGATRRACGARDVDLQGPAGPDVPGRQGQIAFDEECQLPAGPRCADAARPRRRGQDRRSRTSTTDGKDGKHRQAGGPAARSRAPAQRAAEGAAPGLPGRRQAPFLKVPGRRHARSSACVRGDAPGSHDRRGGQEDGQGRGRGAGRGRGRQGGGLDRADHAAAEVGADGVLPRPRTGWRCGPGKYTLKARRRRRAAARARSRSTPSRCPTSTTASRRRRQREHPRPARLTSSERSTAGRRPRTRIRGLPSSSAPRASSRVRRRRSSRRTRSTFFYQVYDLKVDATDGKATPRGGASRLTKDEQDGGRAGAAEQPFDTALAGGRRGAGARSRSTRPGSTWSSSRSRTRSAKKDSPRGSDRLERSRGSRTRQG